ncbi:MAG: DUF2953 domain-containing protein [Oscillospiraceae bacterium]|jgi:hypothetical protein|nr:DUF2953 domain-containing protein [Oscillospiraceae bacterium]
MVFWVSAGVVLALASALTMRLRFTLIVRPGREILLRLRWGVLMFRLSPRAVAGRPARTSKRRAGSSPPKRTADERTDIRALLGPARESAGILLRGLRVDRFYCHVVAGAGDAAHTALLYGSLHAALGLAAPLLARVKRPNVTVGLDYSLPHPQVYLLASVSIRPFALLRTALHFLRRRLAGPA